MQLSEDKLWVSICDPVMIGQDKRRFNGPCFEQIGMIAHFPQLHQDTHDAEEVGVGQDIPRLVSVDVLIV